MFSGCSERSSERFFCSKFLFPGGLQVSIRPRVARFSAFIHRVRLGEFLLVLIVFLLQGCSLAPEREEIATEHLETARVPAIDLA